LAQHYTRRLEYYAEIAPYNWFNFYDFWHPA
jgi:predicted LPLAT superfamily acyltransferase